jgi:hypothetical protein
LPCPDLAKLFSLLKDHDFCAARAQSDGGREAPDSSANDGYLQ